MIGLDIEKRPLVSTKPLSWDLAHHIMTRRTSGQIAVVTDRPVALMSAVRKQWLKIIRQKERERAGSLNPHRTELTSEITILRNMTFTAAPPVDDPQAIVSFATVDQFLQAPPVCRTLYITQGIERHEQYLLTAWIAPRGLVVVYG